VVVGYFLKPSAKVMRFFDTSKFSGLFFQKKIVFS
jgi:hypothetical protein